VKKNPIAAREFSMHEDAALYKSLFQLLDEKPAIRFDDDFNKEIVRLAQKRKRIHDILWKAALYALVAVPLTAISIIVAIAMQPEIFWNMAEYLKNNIGYLLYGSAIFAAIQLLDLILIKNNLPNAET
jgi:hypothetical protein